MISPFSKSPLPLRYIFYTFQVSQNRLIKDNATGSREHGLSSITLTSRYEIIIQKLNVTYGLSHPSFIINSRPRIRPNRGRISSRNFV